MGPCFQNFGRSHKNANARPSTVLLCSRTLGALSAKSEKLSVSNLTILEPYSGYLDFVVQGPMLVFVLQLSASVRHAFLLVKNCGTLKHDMRVCVEKRLPLTLSPHSRIT